MTLEPISLHVGEFGKWTAEKRTADAPDKSKPWELKCKGGHAGWFASFKDAVTTAHECETGVYE